MNAVSMNNLWSYLQGLSLTASNRKWLAEKLIEPIEDKTATPPVLQTWEEALSDLDESEQEFERGDVISGEEFDVQCQALIDSFAANRMQVEVSKRAAFWDMRMHPDNLRKTI